jgi:hypothetical protein
MKSSEQAAGENFSTSEPVPTAIAGRPRSFSGQSSSVDLQINEVVLEGFDPADRYRIGEAMKRELTSLISEGEAPFARSGNLEIEELDAGEINLTPGSSAEAAGLQLAQVIYGNLKQ